MSYLNLQKGIPDFNKAVISLWFRVPKASIDACSEAVKNDGNPFDGIIPLVCLGPSGTIQKYSEAKVVACHTFFKFSPEGPVIPETDLGFTPYWVFTQTPEPDDPPTPATPTCIGVSCKNKDLPTLFINLQTDKKATISNADRVLTSVVAATTYAGTWPPGTTNVDAIFTYASSYLDTECFVASGTIEVTADTWHHVLLSFDLKNVETRGDWPNSVAANTSSASQMWVAFDDENYTESDLSVYWPRESGDPNAILTPNAYGIAELAPAAPDQKFIFASNDPNKYGGFVANAPAGGTASFSLSDPTIDNGDTGHPMGIPATAELVDNIYRVEMAEFQMWTGLTLDTDKEINRRAFVDQDGKPVPPDKKKNPEDSTSRSGSIELLGRKPDILLHGSGNWKIGKNTGTLGFEINSDGEETINPNGQFAPTGGIEKYKPEPALTETPTD